MQLIQSKLQVQLTPARQRQFAWLITCLFVLIALWWLAQLTWRMLTPADSIVTAPVAVEQQRASRSVNNTSALQALNIFGDRAAPEAAEQADIDAPETTLNVRLVGLVASAQPERSAAIIEQGGNQRTYIIGERISGSRASVEQILPDRVLLDNGGRREVLYIEGRDGSEAQLRVMPASPGAAEEAQPRRSNQPIRINASANQQVRQAVDSVRDDPAAILEVMNISPIRDGQQISGYRLSPRGDSELFDALGLQSGDVAVAINGYDLTDPAQALAAMNEIQEASRAIIQVRRGNDIIDLELQVP